MQDQDQTSSRVVPSLSLIVAMREGVEKIALRAEVVVFGHPGFGFSPKQGSEEYSIGPGYAATCRLALILPRQLEYYSDVLVSFDRRSIQ